MAQRVVPTKIVTVTKDGECHLVITLELNININGANEVSASVKSEERVGIEEDNIDFTIPDFSQFSNKKINFGKDDI